MRDRVGGAHRCGQGAIEELTSVGRSRVGRSRIRSHFGAARRIGFALALLLAAFAGLPALADTEYTRPGGYIGLGGSFVIDSSAISDLTENSMGITTRLGYRFTPNIALEGQFEWVDGFDITVAGVDVGRLESWSLTGNLKGLLMTGRIQPFGLIGMGVMRTRFVDFGAGLPAPFDQYSNVTSSGFAMRFGGGVEFYATRNIVVSLDGSYVLPTGNVQDLDYGSIGFGAQWRF